MSLPSLWSETEPRNESGAQTTRYLGTVDQIAKLIKRLPAHTNIYLSVRNSLPCVDALTGKPSNIYFPKALCTSLRISRPDALMCVADMLDPVLQQRGGRIPARLFESDRGDGSRPYRAFYLGA